jgi:hypothetical protein
MHAVPLQVRRPSDFNEEAAAQYGPTRPASYLDKAAVAAMCKMGLPAGGAPGAPSGAGAGLARRAEGPEALYVSGGCFGQNGTHQRSWAPGHGRAGKASLLATGALSGWSCDCVCNLAWCTRV